MMSSEARKAMIELDEAAEKAGGYTAPLSKNVTHFDYRGILKYCKEKGIEPIDMTIREFNSFIIAE